MFISSKKTHAIMAAKKKQPEWKFAVQAGDTAKAMKLMRRYLDSPMAQAQADVGHNREWKRVVDFLVKLKHLEHQERALQLKELEIDKMPVAPAQNPFARELIDAYPGNPPEISSPSLPALPLVSPPTPDPGPATQESPGPQETHHQLPPTAHQEHTL